MISYWRANQFPVARRTDPFLAAQKGNLATSCPLTLLPALSSGGAKSLIPPSRRNNGDSSANAALAWKTNVEKPVSRPSYKPAVVMTANA